MSIPLAALEGLIDVCGVAPRIEALLPTGVRHRQLTVRTLILGMMLALADDRPAHLVRVHEALIAVPEARPGTARHLRRLEYRPAPAHVPAGRAHLQPRSGGPEQGRARRRPLR